MLNSFSVRLFLIVEILTPTGTRCINIKISLKIHFGVSSPISKGQHPASPTRGENVPPVKAAQGSQQRTASEGQPTNHTLTTDGEGQLAKRTAVIGTANEKDIKQTLEDSTSALRSNTTITFESFCLPEPAGRKTIIDHLPNNCPGTL